MIDLITALRLRDSGFPQNKYDKGEYMVNVYKEQENLYFPTTDELIETLANTFYILEKRGDMFYCLKPNQFNDNETSFELSSGTSAPLALANLFLYYNEVNEMEKTTVL